MGAKIKILHTADNHIDPKLRIFGSKIYERKKDFMDSFRKVIEYALERKPDIMLISGDLFDSINPRNPARTFVIKMLRALNNQGIKVFAIAGNHDAPKSIEEGMSPLHELEAAGLITFFSETDPKKAKAEHVNIHGFDVCISGLSYDHSIGIDESVDISNLPTEGDINIAMLHYNLDTLDVSDIWRAPIIHEKDIPKDINYLAMGHLHKYYKIDLGRTLVVYPGSTERRTFAEERHLKKGFVWVEIGEDGRLDVEFVDDVIKPRPIKTVKVDISNETSNIVSAILKAIEDLNDKEMILKIKIVGQLPLRVLFKYKRKHIIKLLESSFFHVIIDDTELRFMPEIIKIDLSEFSLSPLESFKKYMNEAISNAKDDRDKEIIRRAFRFGEQALQEVGAW